MVRKPTLRDVAKLAGTSVATASVVLNGTGTKFVSDDLRRRVLDAARSLEYYPNIPARRMKGKSGKFLAILVPQFENVFFNRVVIGAESFANSRDYTLAIYSTYDQEEKEIRFIENLISLQVDGLLISPAKNQSRSVELIRKAGIPYVVIDRAVPGTGFDLVAIDNYLAAYEGTRLLTSMGHRRIAFIGWKSGLNTITDRVQGFRDAALAAGVGPGEVAVYEVERDRKAAFELALEVLPGRNFTAVFAAQHHVAEGVVEALRELRLKVPEQISVLIYGNPTWASMTEPRFSCIVQPDLEAGRKAAELIIDQLENPQHQCGHHILRTELCMRESVAPPS